MLEIDRSIVGKEQLLARVDELVAAIEANSDAASPAARQTESTLDAPIHEMRVLHRDLHPPVITSQGLKGRVGGTAKRVVRRLTAWYVEPRWEVEQQIEARTIDFASSMFNSVVRIDRELADLRRRNSRLALHVHVLTEQIAALEQRTEASRRTEGSGGTDDDSPGRGAATVSAETRAAREVASHFPPVELENEILVVEPGTGELLALLDDAGHRVIGINQDGVIVDRLRQQGLTLSDDDTFHHLAQRDEHSLKGVYLSTSGGRDAPPELEEILLSVRRALVPEGVLMIEVSDVVDGIEGLDERQAMLVEQCRNLGFSDVKAAGDLATLVVAIK